MARMNPFSFYLARKMLGGALVASSFLAQAALADERSAARVLYHKGNAAFKKGDDVMAREYYSDSLRLDETWETLCNFGRAEAQSKLLAEAYEHLLLCEYLYPHDDELAAARARFVHLRAQVRAELSLVQVQSIEARFDKEVSLRERAQSVPLGDDEALPPAEPAASPAPPAASAAESPQQVGPSLRIPVTASAAESPQQVGPSLRIPVTIALAALGVAGAGVGVGFWVSSASASRKADRLLEEIGQEGCAPGTTQQGQCDEVADLRERQDAQKNISTGALIGGGIALAGAAAVYLLWPSTKTSVVAQSGRSLSHVQPLVSRHFQGISFSQTF